VKNRFALADTLTGKNWRDVKTELNAIVAG
jgi:hypothetical protein